MIHFPTLAAGRLTLLLRELTMAEAIALASMPLNRPEAGITALLRHVAQATQGPQDPRAWTVQERVMAMVHYIACTSRGPRNFAVGAGRVSDYLLHETPDAPDVVDVGEACGSHWTVRQLLGADVEALEQVCKTGAQWVAGAMAATMRAAGDERDAAAPDPLTVTYPSWLKGRMEATLGTAQSEFEELNAAFSQGADALAHLLLLGFSDEGLVAYPVKGGGDQSLAPARFQLPAAIGGLAYSLCGRADQ